MTGKGSGPGIALGAPRKDGSLRLATGLSFGGGLHSWKSFSAKQTEISGIRNRFVHAGFAIPRDVLWQAVGNDLPSLIARLEALVPPEPE